MNWTGYVSDRQLDRAAQAIADLLTPALARLDELARTTPTQLLMAGQYCEPTLFDWGTAT